ncbi:conserved hypothetical protein [Neospora caninum Liverpool]|uniref:Uncharacterized protein n=1 Tax=Neospora caninum (strain Liverpool) TaxID=572307 RepID=F0VKQ5_NEOCL|nr:conserved hypothetical protein [Neospora caninum Liverpool]CBZ54656.1 conserved hypothetical protein [Neospora caninum Liverpool]CEL69373.1 TPA: hypothetical protein BN1204_050840 [Neospora caninum Liverpool]|eukprot:XP_003884686.1 conserved hypothetical protein [Neospora caninum Liverpool]
MSTSKQNSAKPSASIPSSPASSKKSRVQKSDGVKVARKHGDGDTDGDHAPTTAEVISQQILEDVIQTGAALLYRRLIDRRCFSCAAYFTWKVVMSNVKMCCMEFDPGDKDLDASSWSCGEMPEPSPLDTWAPGSLVLKALPSSTVPVQIPKRRARTDQNTVRKTEAYQASRHHSP